MKTLKICIAAISLLLLAISCDKDDDKMIVSGHESPELTATETDVVLNQDNKNTQLLSLVWTGSSLTVSDTSVNMPTGFPIISVQASATADFSNVVESAATSLSRSYSGSELNTLAKDAGLPVGEASPLYLRIKSMLGSNLEPVYSNAVVVNITPYKIDMSLLYVLNKAQENTINTLYSPQSNGEYTGFVTATSWMNIYFREGDGVIWGNDGVSGKPFDISSAASMWSCWFPNPGGCYYVTMSTTTEEWTATYLPSITVEGGASATLEFSTTLKIWTGTITTTTDNAQIKLSSAGEKYNVTTGDKASTAATINFAESQSGILTIADVAGNITIPTAGTYTLKVDLTNPAKYTYTLTSGKEEEEVVEDIPYLYLAGIDDVVSGSWTFDNILTKGSDGIYRGVFYANSKYGFKMYTKAAWGDYFTLGTTAGTLIKNGEGNIPVTEGTYFITVDLTNLTYSMKPLGDVIYLPGLNNIWKFNTTIAKTGNGIYSGTVDVSVKSDYGFQLAIENENWNDYFGGSAGTLYYKSNITDDATVGSYTLTVNLIKGTYQMVLKQ